MRGFENVSFSFWPLCILRGNQTAITSKDKRQGFGPFADVYEEAYGEGEEGLEGGDPLTAHPPPTFLVPLLHPHFIGEDGEGISSR